MSKELDVKIPEAEELVNVIDAAGDMVFCKYINKLSDCVCLDIDAEIGTIEIGDNVSLYRISRVVYDKDERVQDKLTTVYSTVLSLGNVGLFMIIKGFDSYADIYIGVSTKEYEMVDGKARVFDSVVANGNVLEKSFIANFPGSKLEKVKTESSQNAVGKSDLIKSCFEKASYIASVSSIPALRNEKEIKSNEFVQGLEKFIDSMKGNRYSVIIIADALTNSDINERCSNMENIYSQLSPFKQSVQTLNSSEANAKSKGTVEGITNSVSHSVANSMSHGTSISKSNSDTLGVSLGGSKSASDGTSKSRGFNIGGHIGQKAGVNAGLSIGKTLAHTVTRLLNASINYSHTWTRTKTTTDTSTKTDTEGTTESKSKQESITNTLTTTDGKSVQVSYDNRTVKSLLDRIDEQIVRMRGCEDFGMFSTCAYFISNSYSTVRAAAGNFSALTRGEKSSAESSGINIWDNEDDIKQIKEYITRFYHPCFAHPNISFNTEEGVIPYPVSAALNISGREMAFQMPMPKKSVAGIPVIKCAEFGREVLSKDGAIKNTISLGNIFHMNNDEKTSVDISLDNLTAHTFITGSTGSGKSTTVYKLLTEAVKADKNIHFLVVEPAKGEYKNALANSKSGIKVNVFGTNPKITQMLRINPFRFPSESIHIYEHMDKLVELFNVCWPMYAAMPAVLKAAVENAYKIAGWDLLKSENRYGEIFPTFADVAVEVRKYIDRSEYSDENKGNYKGSLLTRLESLTNGINGMIFSGNDIDEKKLFDENTIVDLSRVGSAETKSLIMGMMVLKLQEYRVSNAKASNSSLRHITVLEEAHNLLKRTSTEQSEEGSNLLGKSVEMLANSIAEMRTYGEGFVIADQSPGLLDMSVIRNTNTKIIMRLPDFDDRKLVGKAVNLNDEQIDELAQLPKGVAAVYQSDWLDSVLCHIKKPNIEEEEYKIDLTETYDDKGKSVISLLLDSDFRLKLKVIDSKEYYEFENVVMKSSLNAGIKTKILDVLKAGKSFNDIDTISEIIYSFFSNAEGLINQIDTIDTYTVIEMVVNRLEPSVSDFSNDQKSIILALILNEYSRLFDIDYSIWNDIFNNQGGII